MNPKEGDPGRQAQVRQGRSVAETQTQDKPTYGSVAEAMFTEVVQRTVEELRAKLPPDATPNLSRWIIDFLDRASTPVRVRLKGKVVSVGCLDKIQRNIPAEDPEEYRRVVLPFWMAPEFSILQQLLADLQEEAERLQVKDLEPRLRRYLTDLVQEQSARTQETPQLIPALGVWSRHDNPVGRRVLVLANFTKEAGKRPTDKDVCKRWDLESIPPPEKWAEKFDATTWVKAYETTGIRGRLHKMISGYMKELGIRRK
jgi:hypothetical protein